MRKLEMQEIEHVAGGFSAVVHLGLVDFEFSESNFSSAYHWAVMRTADFFTWWDPAGYYR